MCRNLNELHGSSTSVCLCHEVYYSGDGRNVNGIFRKCCRKETVDKSVDKLWISFWNVPE
jgi:hypothetical protein